MPAENLKLRLQVHLIIVSRIQPVFDISPGEMRPRKLAVRFLGANDLDRAVSAGRHSRRNAAEHEAFEAIAKARRAYEDRVRSPLFGFLD